MVAMLSRMCSLLRQDGHQQWGFWIQGGRDQGQPITINKVATNTIAEIRGLRSGDTVLQIGRERTVDMTHGDAENAVQRAGNRLDILVLRPAEQENSAILAPQKEDKTPIRAIVYKQTNSPIGLYSPENIADTFIEQTKVLTKGALKLRRNPQSIVHQNLRNMQAKSDVYRMVHEEDSSGKFSSSPEPSVNRPYVYGRSSGISGASSPNLQSQSFHKLRHSLNEESDEYTSEESSSASPAPTPTPTFKKQLTAPAPAPPPKPSSSPVHPHHPQHGGGQPHANHQPQQQPQQRPQNYHQPPQPQQYQPQPQQYQPQPQQYQPRPQQQPPQPQPQQYQPRPQQQQPQQYQPQQRQQQQSPQPYQPQQRQQQQSPQQQPQRQPQPQQQPQRQPQPQQQQQQHYQQQSYYQQTTTQQRREEEDYSDRPKYQPYPQVGAPQKQAQAQPRPGSSTFQTQIPFVQNSSPSPQPGEYATEQIQWSPTTGRRRPVWPPQKHEPALSTSAQSMKFAGGRPAKQFIWPPPKDFVEVTEDVQGNQRNVIYRHVPDGEANKARVYVSPRAPARLAADAWEPYSQQNQAPQWMKTSGPSKRLRRFDDIFSSNSTPLPPTYRAPPGTFHVTS